MSKKILTGAVVVAVVALLASLKFFISDGNGAIRKYYDVINHQEKLVDNVLVTDADKTALAACKQGLNNIPEKDCIRNFYDAYTMKNGVVKAFEHLARTQSELPNTLRDCHYFSHGIGNAAFRLSGNNPYKAFDILQYGSVYKNITTCGNGYFHGVIEEFAAGEKNPMKLAPMLTTVCSNPQTKNPANCYHGAGHAILIQLGYNLNTALSTCDKMRGRAADIFSCYTGTFMEYTQTNQGVTRRPEGGAEIQLCNSIDKKYQPACYTEFSYFYERYAPNPMDYAVNIGRCKEVTDPINRMACVKLFAIRSVRIAHYDKVKEMCANTSSDYEKVMCTAIVADKIAGSLDYSRTTSLYQKTVHDICGTLDSSLQTHCSDLVSKYYVQLFYTSERDLSFNPSI